MMNIFIWKHEHPWYWVVLYPAKSEARCCSPVSSYDMQLSQNTLKVDWGLHTMGVVKGNCNVDLSLTMDSSLVVHCTIFKNTHRVTKMFCSGCNMHRKRFFLGQYIISTAIVLHKDDVLIESDQIESSHRIIKSFSQWLVSKQIQLVLQINDRTLSYIIRYCISLVLVSSKLVDLYISKTTVSFVWVQSSNY